MKKRPKREKQTKHPKLRRVMRIIGTFFKTILAIILIVVMVGLIYGFIKVKPLVDNAKTMAFEKMSTIDKNTFKKLSDTEIYDSAGTKIGEINISNYEYAELSNISKFIQDGYIAVEDKNFAIHNGIDYKALLRASIALVKNKGTVTQGGSTITQQVLKNNVIGTDINKWDRKLLEFFLAPEFEKMFTKGDIMEFYCNSNFYQNNCYGVETASKYYFGKSSKDVTLGEAALLVGLSNNPSKYNPVKHPEKALEKRHSVLNKMLLDGKITQEEFDKADAEELNLILEKDKRVKENYQVSFAIHCAALKLMQLDNFNFKYTFDSEDEYKQYKELYNEMYKIAADEVRSGGYKIYTSLDGVKQAKLQECVDNGLSKFKEVADDGRYTMQGSATLINNETQMVEAIVGGRGTEDEYNRGYQGFRQPGSSIKPIIDYAPAFETGKYYPSLVVKDGPIKDGPKNSSGGYIGNITIRDAIARSTNTIAWRVLENIGISNGLSYLGKMKFSNLSYLDTYNSSMALGGFTYGATTYEMAKAYATLANNGVYVDNNCITKLEFQDGTVKFDGKGLKTTVYTADSAYMTLDCLKGVLNEPFGTGKAVKIDGLTLAGKTGTTNDKKDGWFCGASTKYSLSVWCGYDTPKPIDDMSGGKYPGAIFKDMMTYLHNGLQDEDFDKPETVFSNYVDSKGNMTNKDTGKQDLFSRVAIEKLEEEKRIAEEKARKEKEELERKAEEQKVRNIKQRIAEFGNYQVLEASDIEKFDKQYKEISKDINTIKDVSMRKQCLAELEGYYNIINSMTYVIDYRREIAEEKHRKEEEEARIKKEKAAQEAALKLERLKVANDALNSLSNWHNLSEDDLEILKGQAKAAVESCKNYNEYKNLKKKLNSLIDDINNKSTPVIDLDRIDVPVINDNTQSRPSSTATPTSTQSPIDAFVNNDETIQLED